jgi:hypothetical protein
VETRAKALTLEELEQRAADSHIPGVVFLEPEEEWALFDQAVRKWMGISAEEFIARWEAGEYDEIVDTPGYWQIQYLGGFIPSLERPTP